MIFALMVVFLPSLPTGGSDLVAFFQDLNALDFVFSGSSCDLDLVAFFENVLP